LAQSVSADVRQRATSALMRLCARLAHKTEISSLLFATVDTLFVASTNEDLLGCVRSQLATGVCAIVQNNVLHLARSQQCWDTTIALIGKVAVDKHAPIALAALEHAIHAAAIRSPTLCASMRWEVFSSC